MRVSECVCVCVCARARETYIEHKDGENTTHSLEKYFVSHLKEKSASKRARDQGASGRGGVAREDAQARKGESAGETGRE